MEWLKPGEQAAQRILILGGGFAGVYTGYELQSALNLKQARIELGIVNRENFFVYYPLLPEIISGAIETESILNPIRLVVPQATLYVGEVTKIDLENNSVEIRHGLYGHHQEPRTLYYDHLVLALGGVANTARIPGLAEYAFDVQRLSTAFALRNHLIDVLEQADIETNPAKKKRLLTFAVVGGGATGVEVAAEIHNLVVEASDYYKHIEHDDLRVVIVHSGERLFADLPEHLASFAERILQERGIEILFNKRAARVEPDALHLNDDSVIDTRTVVGSIGLQPNPLIRDLPVPHDDRGRVNVNQYLLVEGHSNVWALGDNARVCDPNTGEPYPQSAQHAVRGAKLVARNIAASMRGETLEPMTYKTIGQMVPLGHRSAIAEIRGRSLAGLPAWFIWRTYYLSSLPRWTKKLRVAFDWTLGLFFPPELVQLKVGQPTPTAHGKEADTKAKDEHGQQPAQTGSGAHFGQTPPPLDAPPEEVNSRAE